MPLFECSTCGMVENTALCDFWLQQKAHFEQLGTLAGFCGQCSFCHLGAWHDEFPRSTVEQRNLLPDEHGFLITDERGAVFTELLASLCADERERVLCGIRDGFFGPLNTPSDPVLPPAAPLTGLRKRRST